MSVRRLVLTGICTLVCGALSEPSLAAERGQRWALLIGVNDYADLDDLQYCNNDAQALAERLVEVGFPKENVFLVTDAANDAKNLPTKANIEARIKNILAVAEPGDLVLVSYSGHGVHIDGKTYLCPTDARVDSPESTMIPLSTVYGNLDRSRAGRKLLWVDACRNDPRPAGSRSATSHAESVKGMMESLKTPPEGTITLASCAADQISWEDDSFGHGIFVHYLLEGLSGKADQEERGNRDNRISLMELYNYANIKTKRFVLSSRDRVQTPELFGRITGDFDIAEMANLPSETINSIHPVVSVSAERKRRLQTALPEIRRYLTAFTATGYAQPGTYHNEHGAVQGPMSFSRIQQIGALRKDRSGMEALMRIATIKNDRPAGPIPKYIGGNRAWEAVDKSLLGKVQDLLAEFGPTMVEEGLLAE